MSLSRIAATAAQQGARRSRLDLDLLTIGTFSRIGEKGGQSSAVALSWYGDNARCLENRGDGAGSLLVIEDAYKQWIVHNRDISNAAWTKTSWNTSTPLIAAPDGVVEAQPQSTAITSNACRATVVVTGSEAGIPDASRVCHSAWVIDAAAEAFRFRQTGQDNVVSNSGDIAPTASWARYHWGTGAGTGATTMQAGLQNGNTAAIRAWDAIWCRQLDVGQHFPHRTVRSAASQIDIGADSLTLSAAEGSIFFGGKWRFQELSLDGSDSERDQSLVYDLWSVDANNRVSLRHDGTNWRISAYQGGVLKADSAPLAYGSFAPLGAFDVDPVLATISLDGVSGAVGTPWTWAAAPCRIGGRVGGGNEARARFHPVVVRT